nr:immunoglobulin heavy chain junction region [Macaca mulatta]
CAKGRTVTRSFDYW